MWSLKPELWMQTILLQDDANLCRGLEHSLLCRDDINLMFASHEGLVDLCRSSKAAVVLLAADESSAGPKLVAAIGALDHGPLCLVAADGQQARDLLRQAGPHLGVAGRGAQRHPCRIGVQVRLDGDIIRGRARDLSTSGVFVATTRNCPAGTTVAVELKTAGRGRGLRRQGTVVRSVMADPASERLAGVAVAFTAELSAGQMDELAAEPS